MEKWVCLTTTKPSWKFWSEAFNLHLGSRHINVTWKSKWVVFLEISLIQRHIIERYNIMPHNPLENMVQHWCQRPRATVWSSRCEMEPRVVFQTSSQVMMVGCIQEPWLENHSLGMTELSEEMYEERPLKKPMNKRGCFPFSSWQ